MSQEKPIALKEISLGWQKILPESVRSKTAWIQDRTNDLTENEKRLTQDASPRRLNEFVTARRLARDLLDPSERNSLLERDEKSGAPVWPSGVVGSITHCKELCSVAISENGTLNSLGIDLEKTKRVQSRFLSKIASEHEAKEMESYLYENEFSTDVALAAIFSAKEAFYKFQYPLTGAWLGFRDVEIQISDGKIHFTPKEETITNETLGTPQAILHVTESHVLSVVY